MPKLWRQVVPLTRPGQITTGSSQTFQPFEVGREYHRMGRLRCWEATSDLVRDTYDTVSSSIKSCLEGVEIPSGCMLTWCVYMIGRSKEDANPTILFTCEDSRTRKLARALIEEDQILASCTTITFNVGDCSIPPEFMTSRPLRDRIRPLAGYTSNYAAESTIQDTRPQVVLHASSIVGPGIRIYHGTTAEAPLRSLRHGTVGIIFRRYSKYYATTADHLFYDRHGVSAEQHHDSPPFEFDIAGEADVDTPSNEHESVLEIEGHSNGHYVNNDHSNTRHSHQTVDGTTDQLSRASVVTGRTHSNALPVVEDATGATGDGETVLLGHVMISSSELGYGGLDFALIEIDAANSGEHARSPIDQSCIFEYEDLSGIAYRKPQDAVVVAITSSAGPIRGYLSGTPTYLRNSQGHDFQDVWTVQLEASLEEGDCGSAVQDVQSDRVCGYIVAGAPLIGVAYIVPAFKVHEQIVRLLESNPLVLPIQIQEAASLPFDPHRGLNSPSNASTLLGTGMFSLPQLVLSS